MPGYVEASSLHWAILGPSWGHLGPTWGHLGAVLGHLGAIWGPSWPVLEPSWAILGPSWGLLGPSWGHLGPSWGHLGGRSAQGHPGNAQERYGHRKRPQRNRPAMLQQTDSRHFLVASQFKANGYLALPCHILLTIRVIKILAFRSIAGQVRAFLFKMRKKPLDENGF